MSNTNHDRLISVERQIWDDICDARETIRDFDIADQKGAKDQLDGIAEMPSALSTALNELCNCPHVRDLQTEHVSGSPENATAEIDPDRCH